MVCQLWPDGVGHDLTWLGTGCLLSKRVVQGCHEKCILTGIPDYHRKQEYVVFEGQLLMRSWIESNGKEKSEDNRLSINSSAVQMIKKGVVFTLLPFQLTLVLSGSFSRGLQELLKGW